MDAGYETDPELPRIASAEIITKTTDKSGDQNVVSLVLGNMFSQRRELKIALSYPAETSVPDALEDLLDRIKDTMGVSVASISYKHIEKDTETAKLKLKTGYSSYGYLLDTLKEFLDYIGWHFYFVNQVLYIEPKDFPPTYNLYDIDSSSIIGRPVEMSTSLQGTGSVNGQSGWIFNLFLDGRITVSDRILSTIEGYEGEYTITSLKHVMDYEGSKWITQVVCKKEGL